MGKLLGYFKYQSQSNFLITPYYRDDVLSQGRKYGVFQRIHISILYDLQQGDISLPAQRRGVSRIRLSQLSHTQKGGCAIRQSTR